MLKKRVILLGCVCLLMMIACEKEDAIHSLSDNDFDSKVDQELMDDFLSDDYFIYNNPYVILRKSRKLRSENDLIQEVKTRLFLDAKKVKKFEKKHGYPVWAQVKYATSGSTEVLSIPVARLTANYINAILHVTRDELNRPGQLDYRIAALGDKLSKKEKGNMYNLLDLISINGSEEAIFGDGNCEVIPVLVDEINNIHNGRYQPDGGRDQYCIVTYGYFQDCTTYGGVFKICGPIYAEVISESCYENDGGVSNPPPCELCPAGGGGSGGGTPTIPVPEETIIPVGLSPCASEIVNKIKTGDFGNDMFINLLRDIFDKNADVNITIKESNLGSNIDGEFDGFYTGNLEVGFYFNAELSINSSYTSSGSKDWVLATVIHEMIHGYIQYQRSRVSAGFLSQQDFDREFPLYSSNDPNADHLTMGYQYVNTIAGILQQNNPNLSNEEALSLSRIGLHDTSFWNISLSGSQKKNAQHYNEVGRGNTSDTNSKQVKC